MIATSRRAAFGLGASAAAAILMPASVQAASTSNDAKILRVCDQIHTAEDELETLCDRRITIEDERRTDAEFTAIQNRHDALIKQLALLVPPVSHAAIIAVAKVGLRLHCFVDDDGVRVASDDSNWLLLVCAEALTGEVSG